MKIKLLTFILAIISIVISAQNQPPNIAPDFTATFTNGGKFNLYKFLNSGENRHVIMTAICYTWQGGPDKFVPDVVYKYYGCNNYEVMVLVVSTDNAQDVQNFLNSNNLSNPSTYLGNNANDPAMKDNIAISEQYFNNTGVWSYIIKSDKTWIDATWKDASEIKALLPGMPSHPCTVNINDLNTLSDEIKIYPSITQGKFTLSIDNPINDIFTVEISNAVGQVLLAERVIKNTYIYSNTFDLSSYQKGFYFVNITGPTGVTSKKIMIH